jgi:hypothetical protein
MESMRKVLLSWFAIMISILIFGQRQCKSFEYQNQLTQKHPFLKDSLNSVERFIQSHSFSSFDRTPQSKIIEIPVVVHVLYHYPGENISDDLIASQITALNRDFRKKNADTVKIPQAFKSLAADCNIEFQLASVDAQGRATTGIVRKYTPITKWIADDKIKLSSEMGDDPWDTKSYLNIWVGTLDRILGYSSMPGDPAYIDGVVISNKVFGITKSGAYDNGRTTVHEIGHWLGLKHIWGDKNCGDDGIADTPKQATFTNGCPSGVRISCNNGPNGDMYMNYMDFTNDDCLVMFTQGQKKRMLSLFQANGPRYSILLSHGLETPNSEESPLPDDSAPQWLHVNIYPNPAHTQLTLNVAFDVRWIGKELVVLNELGQIQIKTIITSKIQTLNISNLKPGIYFISAKKDKDKILQEFIKL